MPGLKARTVPVSRLSPEDRDAMFAVFERYYAEVTREQFEADLAGKNAVIVLCDTERGDIQGFSTLRKLETTGPDGRICRAVFSGDTVVDQAYWGQKVLGVAFLAYMLRCKLRRPFEPLYWFLISKGYKTYLLMANNFVTHYPRHERPTPPGFQALIDRLGHELFGEHYHPEEGLIRHPRSMGQLREGVAEISEAERASHPRIRFFAERNPDWHEGVELACVAEMTFTLPFMYAWKRLVKVTMRRDRRSTASPASVADTRASAAEPRVPVSEPRVPRGVES